MWYCFELSKNPLSRILHQSTVVAVQKHALADIHLFGALDIVSAMRAHPSVAKARHEPLLDGFTTRTEASCGLVRGQSL
jgi:hypothetical protein